jgi:hypothetical protein
MDSARMAFAMSLVLGVGAIEGNSGR